MFDLSPRYFTRYLSVLLASSFVFACGASKSNYTAPPRNPPDQTNVSLEEKYSVVWKELIQLSSESSFSIDNYDKKSGLITLGLSVEPDRFVDCGTIKTSGALVARPFDGSLIGYMERGREAKMTLDGQVRITVGKTERDQTTVSVNTNYEVAAETVSGTEVVTWKFSTGGADTVTLRGSGRPVERTCRPTHVAEQIVIEGIQRAVSS
jgi:hypothetical protein